MSVTSQLLWLFLPFSATATVAECPSDGGGACPIPLIVAGLVERADACPSVPLFSSEQEVWVGQALVGKPEY